MRFGAQTKRGREKLEREQQQSVTGLTAGTSSIVGLGGGFYNLLMVTEDGDLYGTGSITGYFDEELGEETDDAHPWKYLGISGVKDVAATDYDTIAVLKTDGTVWVFGDNDTFAGIGNSLGLGPITSTYDPDTERWIWVQVEGVSNITRIEGGEACYMALEESGILWGWGKGTQIDPTGVGFETPSIIANLSDVVKFSVGTDHAAAIRADGNLYTWGSDTDGCLGINVFNDFTIDVPVQIAAGVSEVACGSWHTTWIEDDGSVHWAGDPAGLGSNYVGPTDAGFTGTATKISAGFYWNMVVDDEGQVWTCGSNSDGSLGRTPPPLSSGLEGATEGWGMLPEITGAESIFCAPLMGIAVTSGCESWVWGYDEYTLGVNDLPNTLAYDYDDIVTPRQPVTGQTYDADPAVPGTVEFASLSGGGLLGVAANAAGDIYLWSMFGGWGTLIGNFDNIMQLEATDDNVIVLTTDGDVWMYGPYSDPGITDGTWHQVSNMTNVTKISAGDGAFAALTFTGEVVTAGTSTYGELGSMYPEAQSGAGTTFTYDYDGHTVMWPSSVLDDAIDVAMGTFHGFVQRSGNRTSAGDGNPTAAWGLGNYGQKGKELERMNWLTDSQDTVWHWQPFTEEIMAGGLNTYIRGDDGRIWVFGNNNQSECALDSKNYHPGPGADIPDEEDNGANWPAGTPSYDNWAHADFATPWFGQVAAAYTVQNSALNTALESLGGLIAAGWGTALAYGFVGEVWGWGADYYGMLGDPDLDTSEGAAYRLPHLDRFEGRISIGRFGMLGIEDGNLYGWGWYMTDENGDEIYEGFPVEVMGEPELVSTTLLSACPQTSTDPDIYTGDGSDGGGSGLPHGGDPGEWTGGTGEDPAFGDPAGDPNLGGLGDVDPDPGDLDPNAPGFDDPFPDPFPETPDAGLPDGTDVPFNPIGGNFPLGPGTFPSPSLNLPLTPDFNADPNWTGTPPEFLPGAPLDGLFPDPNFDGYPDTPNFNGDIGAIEFPDYAFDPCFGGFEPGGFDFDPCADGGGNTSTPGSGSGMTPDPWPDNGEVIIDVDPPYDTDARFDAKKCYVDYNAETAIRELCALVGVDPTQVMFEESCNKTFTKCFEQDSRIFDAIWWLADYCGFEAFDPGDGSIEITPTTPLDVIWVHNEFVDLVEFSRNYDNIDVYPAVEVYRIQSVKRGRIAVPGFTWVEPVNTVFDVSGKDPLRIEAPQTWTDQQIIDEAKSQAAKMKTGLNVIVGTPLNTQARFRHQIVVQKPSKNFNMRFMITRTTHSINPDEGNLSMHECKWLGVATNIAYQVGLDYTTNGWPGTIQGASPSPLQTATASKMGVGVLT